MTADHRWSVTADRVLEPNTLCAPCSTCCGRATDPVAVDGIFGVKTEAAVRAFQMDKHLSVDGVVGPKTWSALIITVKRGSQGDAVRGVQEEFCSARANPARA